MKKIWALIFLCSLVSCKSVKQVPVNSETVIRYREIPIVLPADSAIINISLESGAGSSGVNIVSISEEKTPRVSTSVDKIGNTLKVKFQIPKDTIRLTVTDTTKIKEIPLIIETQKKGLSNVLGIFLSILLVVIVIFFLILKILK